MQKKKNIASPSTTQHHDTPNNKTHFIKFRVTEIEKNGTRTYRKTLKSLPLHSHSPRTSQRKNREKDYRCEQRRRNTDRCFHVACSVQQR